jgi:hypothetical protein
MLSAAKDESVPLLAASLLSENSRPGFGGCDSELRRVIELANVLNASGLATSLYDDRIGSRDTGKEREELPAGAASATGRGCESKHA